MGTVVTAPLAVVRDGEGKDVYLYKGSPVPDNLQDGEAKRLIDGGYAVSDDAAGPSEKWTVDELKAYAEEHDVDLGGAVKKADILAAITSVD